jgi:hypothetical protein
MLWLKRNLLLTVGGLIAVLLLGFGIYYLWTSYQKNKEVETKLEQNKEELRKIVTGPNPYPNSTNIARAREELGKVRTAITNARAFFQPVPYEPVTGLAFKSLLDSNLFELHRKAEETSVVLPNKNYGFTFEFQKKQLNFPTEAFPGLPQQLAEIKTICNLLFDARINKLITLRRARIYTDEPVSQVDHHEMKPSVDEAMGMASNPYELTFHCFSGELATVLESFYKSTNGLIVKSLQVEVAPAEVVNPNQPGNPVTPVAPPPAAVQPRVAPPTGAVQPPAQPAPGVVRPTLAAAPAAPKGAEPIKTVLNERLLKIVLVLDVTRALPPKAAGAQKI